MLDVVISVNPLSQKCKIKKAELLTIFQSPEIWSYRAALLVLQNSSWHSYLRAWRRLTTHLPTRSMNDKQHSVLSTYFVVSHRLLKPKSAMSHLEHLQTASLLAVTLLKACTKCCHSPDVPSHLYNKLCSSAKTRQFIPPILSPSSFPICHNSTVLSLIAPRTDVLAKTLSTGTPYAGRSIFLCSIV